MAKPTKTQKVQVATPTYDQAQPKIETTPKTEPKANVESAIVSELGVLKAQNEVLLALIKGYFETNVQTVNAATALLTEGVKAFKSYEESRFEWKRSESELRMNIEQLKVENEFEIEKAKIELEHRRLANERFAARAREEFSILELNFANAKKNEEQSVKTDDAPTRRPYKTRKKAESIPSVDEIAKVTKQSIGKWDGNFDAIKDTTPIYIETKVDTDKIVKRGRKKTQK